MEILTIGAAFVGGCAAAFVIQKAALEALLRVMAPDRHAGRD